MFTSQMLPDMPANTAPSVLSVEDQEVLRIRAIAPEVAAQRGCRSITASEARRYGFGGDHARAGLLIPSHGTQGEIVRYQLRPHAPVCDADGKIRKYLWPAASRQSLDVPPALRPLLGQVDIPVILAESSLKGDALLSAIQAEGTVPHAVVAAAGVWGWRSQGAPISDFNDLPWCRRGRDRRITFHRTALVVFDSDTATNPHVANARWELTEFLRRKGAAVHWIDLPPGPDGAKQGVDDYLAARGTLAALLTAAYPAPDRPPIALGTDTSSTPEPLADEDLVAQLRRENEQLQRLVSAQAQLLRTPRLKERQKRFAFAAITCAHARRARGEVTPDGFVVLSTSEVASDFRPEPPKGERAVPTNPRDGSLPLGDRDKVRPDLRPLREAGALDFIERPVTREHADGTRYHDTEILIRVDDVADCAAALMRLHQYGRPPRKMPTSQPPCRHCGEIHARTRKVYCGSEEDAGCGALIGERVLPVPPISNPDATSFQRAELEARACEIPRVNPRPPLVEIADEGASSEPEESNETAPSSGSNYYMRSILEETPPAASSGLTTMDAPLPLAASQKTTASLATCVDCGDPLPPGHRYRCSACVTAAYRAAAELSSIPRGP